MICLFTLTKSDPSSEHQPRPLRVRRSPRPQFCSDLNDAGVNEICNSVQNQGPAKYRTRKGPG